MGPISGSRASTSWPASSGVEELEDLETDLIARARGVPAGGGGPVREDDHRGARVPGESQERRISPRAAVVPDHPLAAGAQRAVMPAQADAEPVRHDVLVEADGVTGGEDARDAGIALPEVGRREGQEVVDGRSDGAGAGERAEIPIVRGFSVAVVRGRQAGGHLLGERDPGVVHSQRLRDPLDDELLVGHGRGPLEEVAEQAHAQVRVLVSGVHGPFQAVGLEEIVQAVGAVIGVRVVGLAGQEVGGEPGKTGAVRRQVAEEDFLVGAAGRGAVLGEVEPDRVVQPEHALLGEVGQEERGEDLGDGADLVDGVAAGLPLDVPGDPAIPEHRLLLAVDDADGEPGRLGLGQVLLDDLVDGRGAGGIERRSGAPRQQAGDEKDGERATHDYASAYQNQKSGIRHQSSDISTGKRPVYRGDMPVKRLRR